MTHTADGIVCDAPAGRIEGAAAYREFMAPFAQILKRAELIAAFGDDEAVVLMYDTDTLPVSPDSGMRIEILVPPARPRRLGSF